MNDFRKTSFLLIVLSVLFQTSEARQAAPVYQARTGAIPAPGAQNVPNNGAAQPNAGSAGETILILDDDKKPQHEPNIFLDQSEKKDKMGTPVFKDGTSFFRQNGRDLEKRTIPISMLKKAVIIFFGDWCPSCVTFLQEFSKHADLLSMYGVKILLVNVPPIEILKNWRDPNVDEFNNAENKVSSFNIKLSRENIEMLCIEGKSVLKTSDISSLPVMIVSKNSNEVFRSSGSKATTLLQKLGTPDGLKQFLSLFEEDMTENLESTSDDKTSDEENNKKSRKKKENKSSKKRTKQPPKKRTSIEVKNSAAGLADKLNAITGNIKCFFGLIR